MFLWFDKIKDVYSYLCFVSCIDNIGFGYWYFDVNDGFIKLFFLFKKKWVVIFMLKMFCFNEKKILLFIIFSKFRYLFVCEEFKV